MALLTSGVKALDKTQIGFEGTAGTEADATLIWRGLPFELNPADTKENAPEFIGVSVPTQRAYTPAYLTNISTPEQVATYEQLGVILTCAIQADRTGSLQTAVEYNYTYTLGGTSIATIDTATIEGGDNQQEYQSLHCFVTDYTIRATAGEAAMVSANWIGRRRNTGTFTAALSPIAVEEILASAGQLWVDSATSAAQVGTTQVSSSVIGFELNVTTGWVYQHTIDNNSLDLDFIKFDGEVVDFKAVFTYEHNSDGVAVHTDYQADTPKVVRIQFLGSTLASGSNFGQKAVQIDMYGNYTEVVNGNQNGNNIVTGTLSGRYDADVDDIYMVTTIANGLASF